MAVVVRAPSVTGGPPAAVEVGAVSGGWPEGVIGVLGGLVELDVPWASDWLKGSGPGLAIGCRKIAPPPPPVAVCLPPSSPPENTITPTIRAATATIAAGMTQFGRGR